MACRHGRTERHKTLSHPSAVVDAVNMRVGALSPAEDSAVFYIKIPPNRIWQALENRIAGKRF